MKITSYLFTISALVSSASLTYAQTTRVAPKTQKISTSKNAMTVAATTPVSSSETTDSLPVQKQTQKISTKSDTQRGLSVSVYYNSMNQMKADKDVEFQSGTVNVKWKNFTTDVEQSPGLMMAYQQKPTEGFGFMAGAFIEKQRKITNIKADVEVNGIAAGSLIQPRDEWSLELWGLEGNAIYSFGDFYVPFGAHIPFVTIKGNGSSVTNQAGFGTQAAIGFQPVNWFGAELGARYSAVSVKLNDAKESTVLSGAGVTLMTKFSF